MTPALDLLAAAAAFGGHFALAVYLFNRLHARPWQWKLIKVLEKSILAIAALVVAMYLIRSLLVGGFLWSWAESPATVVLSGPWLWYVAVAWLTAGLAILLWLVPKLLERRPAALVSNDTHVVDVEQRLGSRPFETPRARLLGRFPGNEALRLHVHRKTLRLAGLPPQLDGLTVAHLSDLHMTGDLGQDFYREIVAATNDLAPDLVAITGDILEKARCLPWIEPTLGRLEARYGKWFVLGNHDQRVPDVAQLRRLLAAAGIQDLGSRCEMLEIAGASLLIAGLELPWFGAYPQSPISNPKSPIPFRLLLSHTPDYLPWAREERFDLMLAGHNHGGQIRLPGLGALICPSRYGYRYAGGLYHEPPTLLHVSRGLSGLPPLRLNCPPEIALLVLERGSDSQT